MGVTGGFVAPYFIGYMKDLTGNFQIPFLTIAAFSVLVSVLFYFVGSRQQRARDAANALADARA